MIKCYIKIGYYYYYYDVANPTCLFPPIVLFHHFYTLGVAEAILDFALQCLQCDAEIVLTAECIRTIQSEGDLTI